MAVEEHEAFFVVHEADIDEIASVVTIIIMDAVASAFGKAPVFMVKRNQHKCGAIKYQVEWIWRKEWVFI